MLASLALEVDVMQEFRAHGYVKIAMCLLEGIANSHSYCMFRFSLPPTAFFCQQQSLEICQAECLFKPYSDHVDARPAKSASGR